MKACMALCGTGTAQKVMLQGQWRTDYRAPVGPILSWQKLSIRNRVNLREISSDC